VREVLPKLRHPEVLRYFVLSSHYRGPINYSLDQLEQADSALSRIYTALRDLPTGVSAARPVRFRRTSSATTSRTSLRATFAIPATQPL